MKHRDEAGRTERDIPVITLSAFIFAISLLEYLRRAPEVADVF